jgi:hypothetical protein
MPAYEDDTDWTLISFEPKTPPPAPKPAAATSCPHCGRKLGRGGHFHVKRCKDKAQ